MEWQGERLIEMADNQEKTKQTMSQGRRRIRRGFETNSSALGKNIDELGDDLMVEILSHLPTKMILRCRCVCRKWRSLISLHPHIPSRCRPGYRRSGFFVFPLQRYSWSSKTKPLFIPSLDDEQNRSNYDSHEFSFSVEGEECQSGYLLRPLSMCNGLLLCWRGPHKFKKPLVVYNPETGEYAYISPSNIEIPTVFLFGLKFELSNIYVYGLAFDPDTGSRNVASYKVVVGVLTSGSEYPRRFFFKIYSSKSQVWKWVELLGEGRHFRRLEDRMTASVFYHGVLHWLVDVDCMITFNPSSQKSRWVDLPSGGKSEVVGQHYPIGRLVEWGGQLYYVRISITWRLDVWKMVDYSCCCSNAGDGWLLLHSIKEFAPHLRNVAGLSLYPMGIDHGGDTVLIFTKDSKILSYNLKSGKFGYPLKQVAANYRAVGPFSESAVPWYFQYNPTTKFLTK